MIKAIIFDMDGLLIDSEPKWDRARADMAERLGKEWGRKDHEAVMGVSTEEWATYMRDTWAIDMSLEDIVEEIVSRMRDYYREQIPFRKNAVEAVTLAAEHYRTALASGSERSLIDIVTTSDELGGKFEVVLSADQVERGKPHPDVYLETARHLGVAPQHCLCLEDSKNGMLAGLNAGFKVIGIPDKDFPVDKNVLDRVDVVLDSLDGFTVELIESLN